MSWEQLAMAGVWSFRKIGSSRPVIHCLLALHRCWWQSIWFQFVILAESPHWPSTFFHTVSLNRPHPRTSVCQLWFYLISRLSGAHKLEFLSSGSLFFRPCRINSEALVSNDRGHSQRETLKERRAAIVGGTCSENESGEKEEKSTSKLALLFAR